MPIDLAISEAPSTLSIIVIGCIGTVCYVIWTIWSRKQWLRESEPGTQSASRLALSESAQITDEQVRLEASVALLTTDLERSQTQLAEHTQHLKMLYQVTEQLNHETELSGVISVTLESLWQAAEIDFIAVLLGEDELGPFHYAGIRGVDDPLAVLGQECELPLWGTMAQALVNHPPEGEPDYLVINDIDADGRPTPGEFPWHVTQGSLLIIPVRQGGRTLGAFLVGSLQPNYFLSDSLRHYLYAIAGTTARAIQEAQARQQTATWIKRLVSLQSLTHTITRTRHLDKILDVLYTELRDLFGEADVQVFLNRGEETEATLPAPDTALSGQLWFQEPHPVLAAAPQMVISDDLMDLVRWVMKAEQPLFFDPTVSVDDVSELYYRSTGRGLMVPIGEDNAEGVIYLSVAEHSTPFEESDLIVVRTIGNSIAIALGNTYLYEQLQHERAFHSATNRLTGQEAADAAASVRVNATPASRKLL